MFRFRVRVGVRVKVRHIDPSDDVMLAPFIFRSLQAVTLQPVRRSFRHRCAHASSWVRRLRSELAAPYANHTWPIIGQVLQNLASDRLTMLLVVQSWPCAPWFGVWKELVLKEMFISEAAILDAHIHLRPHRASSAVPLWTFGL